MMGTLREDYTVGWLCAKDFELDAARAMLDKEYTREMEPDIEKWDHNSYTFGRIHEHHVVIAVLPLGCQGTTPATTVATHMLSSFPNTKVRLMVGIGGGAPTKDNDIRLGDVVVSVPISDQGGVFQYDYGKAIQNQEFKITGHMDKPPGNLLKVVSNLKSKHKMYGNQITATVRACVEKNDRLQKGFSKPGQDRLYKTQYDHNAQKKCDCENIVIKRDDIKQHLQLIKERPIRTKDEDDPKVHYGLIASANTVLRDAVKRDKFAADHKVLCFEMEAAGLMNDFACLVIRGIADYCDTHKNDDWQEYAAATAAAYAKELLKAMPGIRGLGTRLHESETSDGQARTERYDQSSTGRQALPWYNNSNTDGPSNSNSRLVAELEYRRQSHPLTALRSLIQRLQDDDSLLVKGLDYWSHMTLSGYMIYDQIFKLMCKNGGQKNILWFATCLGNTSPTPTVLIEMWERFRSNPSNPKALPDCYLVALLYMLHMEVFCDKFSQQRPEMDSESPKEIHWKRLKTLRSFTTFVDCPSPPEGCNITWNFVSQDWGMPLVGKGTPPSNCSIYKRYLEREEYRLAPSDTQVPTAYSEQENEFMNEENKVLYRHWYQSGWRG